MNSEPLKTRLGDLKTILANNPETCFLEYPLQDKKKAFGLNWQGLERKREATLEVLKAYQRLLRILPEGRESLAFPLLELEIHSAVQISSMPKTQFLDLTSGVLKDDPDLADRIYRNAQEKRSRIVVQYMDVLQSNEPHVKTAKV